MTHALASLISLALSLAAAHWKLFTGVGALPLFGMAIVNSVGTATAGYGSGLLFTSIGNALVDGANTVNVPVSPSIARGKIRVKIYGPAGTSPAFTDLIVNAKDGTNSVRIGSMSVHPASAFALTSTAWFEMIGEFLLDDGLASGNGGAAGTLITQGATSFDVIATLSGTGETAKMDVEICGEP